MEEPEKRMKLPWWAWLIIMVFPIPIGTGPWWLAAIFVVLFGLLVWAIVDDYKNNPSNK